MTTPLDTEDIAQYQALLTTHRRTLAIYIRQQAAIGEHFSPPALVSGIGDARDEIRRIKALLRTAGVAVADGPDDEDHDDTPLLVDVRRPVHPAWVAALASAALLIVVLLALVFRPVGTGAETAAQPDSEQVVFAETFGSGQASEWSGNSEEWTILASEGGFVYQGQGISGDSADTAPAVAATSMKDYAVEVRYRLVQPDAAPDLPDLYLTLRTGDFPNGCLGYGFSYYDDLQQLAIARFGNESCPFVLLGTAPFISGSGWHTLRAEARGEQVRLLIDGREVLSATDSSIAQGGFHLSVSRGAVVQFDSVRVLRQERHDPAPALAIPAPGRGDRVTSLPHRYTDRESAAA